MCVCVCVIYFLILEQLHCGVLDHLNLCSVYTTYQNLRYIKNVLRHFYSTKPRQ